MTACTLMFAMLLLVSLVNESHCTENEQVPSPPLPSTTSAAPTPQSYPGLPPPTPVPSDFMLPPPPQPQPKPQPQPQPQPLPPELRPTPPDVELPPELRPPTSDSAPPPNPPAPPPPEPSPSPPTQPIPSDYSLPPELRPTPPPDFPPWEDPDDIYFSNGPHRQGPPSMLDQLGMPNATLIEKIVRLEDMVCGSTCGPDFPSTSPRSWSWPACQTCQCDVTCAKYHTCCPDVVLHRKVTLSGLGSECVQLVPTPIESSFDEVPPVGLHSSMITRCDSKHYENNNNNNNTKPVSKTTCVSPEELERNIVARFKCERADISKPDEALPVSDTRTDITYRNVYCARCNGVQDDKLTYRWAANVSCDLGADWLLRSLPGKLELFETFTRTDFVGRTGCRMVYEPKLKEYRRECRPVQGRIIKTCNESGQIDPTFFDADIERACHSYTSLFMNRFKNVFCYLCNQYFPLSLGMLLEQVQKVGGNPARVSFSALIDFTSDDGDDDDDDDDDEVTSPEAIVECGRSEFFDNTTCSCRKAVCGEWQTFHAETGTCQRQLRSQNVGYRACLEVVVELPSGPSFDIIRNLPETFQEMEPPSHRMALTVSRWCPGYRTLVMHSEIWETEKKPDGSDEFGHDFEQAFQDDGVWLCDHLLHLSALGPNTSCAFEMVDNCPELRRFSLPCVHREVHPLNQVQLLSRESTPDPFEEPVEINFLPYKRREHCPIVEIPATDFNEFEDNLMHNISSMSIAKSKVDLTANNSAITLCLHDYLQWTPSNASRCALVKNKDDDSDDDTGNDTGFDVWTTEGLISIISSCISLFFLLLTFVTYLLFTELRTRGWKNVMVLCATLFIACVFFEFTIEQFENSTVCSALGVLIHYFWLASVFSMNACTIERFVKLCFPLESRSFFMSEKPFALATTHTFVCPLVIVGCNIVANYATKNRCGYGSSSICFINGKYSRAFSFLAPILLIVLLNTVLLAVTIIKLRRRTGVSDNHKASQPRIGLVACVRLSVVTGAAWLISILYQVAPYPVMGYLFTLCLGLQGLVFFVSLLANKRVWQLYTNLLRPKVTRHSSSGSGTSKGQGTATDFIDDSSKEEKSRKTNFDDVITKTNIT